MQAKKNPLVTFVVRQPWVIISLTLALTLFLGFGASKLKFDSDLSDDIPDTIPEKAFFDEVGRIFPSDDSLFIALGSKDGIWNQDYLSMVKEWSDTIEGMPGVKGVLSLSNAGLIRGTADGIEISDAMPTVPSSAEELATVKSALEGSDIAKALISKDGKASILLVSLKEGLDNQPIPHFVLSIPKGTGLPSDLADRLGGVTGLGLDPFLDSVTYDTEQWKPETKTVSFGLSFKQGFDPLAQKNAIAAWIRESGRADWGVKQTESTIDFTVAMNPNEAPDKTRRKIETFLAKAQDLRAPLAESKSVAGVTKVLAGEDPRTIFEASATYRVDLKGTDGESKVIIVPSPDAYTPSVEAGLKAALVDLPQARLEYFNAGIPFYFRVQNAISFLEQAPDTTIYISGSKAVSNLVQGLLVKDLSVLFPVVILIIMLMLYFSFRTLRGVFLPLGNVVIAVVWIVGLMGWLGVPLSQATAVLPIILIAVGTAYTIHVINRYYEDLAHSEDRHMALENTLGHVAVPVLLAGVTTIIGFGSLALSNLAALQAFGILSALGIFFGLLLSLTFSVSVLSVLSRPKLKTVDGFKDTVYTRNLEKLGRNVVARPLVWVIGFVLVLGVFAFGIPKVRFETNTLESFKPETDIRKSSEYLNDQFTGITVLQVILQVPEEGGILEPRYLGPLDGLGIYLESLRVRGGTVYAPETPGYNKDDKQIVGGSQSITTFVKGINKALNADNNAFNVVPGELNPVVSSTETYRLISDKQFVYSLEELDSETGEVLATYQLDPGTASTTLEGQTAVGFQESLAPEGSFRLDDGAKTAVLAFPGTVGRLVSLDSSRGASQVVTDLIPGRSYIGQLVFQYENSGKPETIESFIDNPRKTARMNVFLRTASSTQIAQVQAFTQGYIKANFAPEAKADLTGSSQLTLTILKFLVSTQLSSLLSSLLVIFVMITLLSRSAVEGLFSLVPLTFSILFNFGLMGWFNIPVDISTSTIASIAIGIGIDYTLHFMERFKVLCRNLSPEEAVVQTMRTTGVGIFFNALAVAAGFAALMASQVLGNFYIGLLMALIMVTSSLGAVTILPALLVLIKPKFIRKQVLKAELNDGFSPQNKIDTKAALKDQNTGKNQ